MSFQGTGPHRRDNECSCCNGYGEDRFGNVCDGCDGSGITDECGSGDDLEACEA